MYQTRIPPEHAAIPLWACEDLYWEDFEIGHRIRTIRRTLSEGENKLGSGNLHGTFLAHPMQDHEPDA